MIFYFSAKVLCTLSRQKIYTKWIFIKNTFFLFGILLHQLSCNIPTNIEVVEMIFFFLVFIIVLSNFLCQIKSQKIYKIAFQLISFFALQLLYFRILFFNSLKSAYETIITETYSEKRKLFL